MITEEPEPIPQAQSITSYEQDVTDDTFDYPKAVIKLKALIGQWKEEVNKTLERRNTRDVEIDVRKLRASGKLDQDETLIPDRVIDTNITREQPPYINYLKNSRRLAIFTCVSNPDVNTQKLELDFTRGMTYIAWETPHFKCLDGAQTHAWDTVEVVYDEDKPLHCGLEQVGHDKLFFPLSNQDIQTSPFVIREYNVTSTTLKSFVDNFGFDSEQVGKILDGIRNKVTGGPETVPIYKRLCKYNGQVYVAWFSTEYGCDNWLKKPLPLYLGIRHKEKIQVQEPSIDEMTGLPTMRPVTKEQWVDTPITQYPIFILPYRETEKPRIIDHKGRVFLDENKQEAQTAVLSAFINGLTRASNVYTSLDVEDGSGSSVQALENTQMIGSRIWSKPLRFFSPPYPDPMVLKAMQWMDVANDAEIGQPNFAATNRQDSRKTAKEITAAQNEQQLLNSVQLTLFSTHIRAIYNLAWLIVQSQALQGKIKFLLVEKQIPQINPITQQPVIDPMTGQPVINTVWVNDIATIAEVFDIRAAGDVDVVQKQEKVMQMKQDWPVVANTSLAIPFLAELMRLQYPDSGEKWANVLEQQMQPMQQMQGMISQMSNILAKLAESSNELDENDRAGLTQILQQAQQLTGAQRNGKEVNA